MKITVKTLSGKQLPLDIETEWSIRKVKEEIEKVHDLKADTLKLIAYGKVLEDDSKSAADYNIKENDFIVAMVQKAKPPPKSKKEDEKKEEPVAAPSNPQPAAQAQPQPVAQPQPQPQPTVQAHGLSPEVEAAVNELMAISGKPKDLCTQALAAAQGIPDVAFEFLMSGYIPQMGSGSSGGGQADYDDEMGDEDDGAGLGNYNLDP
jgi:UV excision repair protein RAD23